MFSAISSALRLSITDTFASDFDSGCVAPGHLTLQKCKTFNNQSSIGWPGARPSSHMEMLGHFIRLLNMCVYHYCPAIPWRGEPLRGVAAFALKPLYFLKEQTTIKIPSFLSLPAFTNPVIPMRPMDLLPSTEHMDTGEQFHLSMDTKSLPKRLCTKR